MPHPEVGRDAMVGLLEAAAARLRDKGWLRGELGPVAGPNCVIGALKWEAIARLGTHLGFEADATWALARFLGDFPTAWNDSTCPDAAAAVDALLNTAKEVAGGTLSH